MADQTEPIARRKLSHQISDRLVAAIRSGEYPPGSQMPSERTLMARYGVGRPAIREAMQALHQQGLIRILHGERARVTAPTAEGVIGRVSDAMAQLLATSQLGLEDLKEARLLFETGLVRLAVQRATPDGVEGLRRALAEGRASRGDRSRFVAADMAFHRQIAAMSGNGLIAAVSSGMLEWLTHFKRDVVSVREADELTLSEHQRVLDAVAACDADGAAAAMRDHLTRANALYSVLTAGDERAASPAPPEG